MSHFQDEISRFDAMSLEDPTVADQNAALDDLPRVNPLQVRFAHRARRLADPSLLAQSLFPGVRSEVGATEFFGRTSGLNRPGVIAQLAWPRLDARLGVGVETPLAHAIVDQLLGFERLPAEANRQVTPVEFGILTFVFARALDRLDALPGPFGPWDLTIDRVGPDPFDPVDLGPLNTWRWPVRIGAISGSVRVWIPESILFRLDALPPVPTEIRPSLAPLASTWRAEAGSITLARGLSRLKAGGVLTIDGGSLKGTVATPSGPIALFCRHRDGVAKIAVQAVANSSAGRVSVTSLIEHESTPREPLPVNPSPSPSPGSSTPDIPVTLVVELGRVNLTLSRLADLKLGDVIELGRHSREPVELTSNGKLVARGELVQIDTELGVRITNVLL